MSLKLFGILVLVFMSVVGAFRTPRETTSVTPNPGATSTHMAGDTEYLPLIRELMVGDEICVLPCFLGLQPGQTTLVEVEAFSQVYLDRDLISGHVTTPDGITYRSLMLDLLPSGSNYAVVIAFTFEHEILSRMEVHLSGLDEWLPEHGYNPSTLLGEMPSLPETYIGVNASTGVIALLILDNHNGIMAQYELNLRVKRNVISPNADNPLLLCPQSGFNGAITLWLQDTSSETPLETLISNPSLPNSSVNFYQPLEWMTGLDDETFVEQVLSNPDDCIEMLSYPELLQQGYEF